MLRAVEAVLRIPPEGAAAEGLVLLLLEGQPKTAPGLRLEDGKENVEQHLSASEQQKWQPPSVCKD